MTFIDLTDRAKALAGSQPLRAYRVTPAGDGPWPAVLMVHEAFGLDEVMLRQADRLAEAGYLTLAVDLYSTGSTRSCLVSTLRALSRGEGRAFADIEAGRQELLADPDCTGKIGVIGFCMGGGFALLVADDGFDVASVNYGRLPKDLDAALEGACPIVASYGGRDRSLKNAAATLEAGLRHTGVEHDVKEYPSAGHAFLNDAPAGPRLLRPLLKIAGMGPEPTAAADAWRRIDSFFARHLR